MHAPRIMYLRELGERSDGSVEGPADGEASFLSLVHERFDQAFEQVGIELSVEVHFQSIGVIGRIVQQVLGYLFFFRQVSLPVIQCLPSSD
jgi:hypothetical protein